MTGELARVSTVVWTSDQQHIVLEIPDESSKASSDAQRCTWAQLFREIEDQGVPEFSVNCHTVVAPSVDSGVPHFLISTQKTSTCSETHPRFNSKKLVIV